MIISKYLSDLLYKHECIVIPGLGGFITHHSSAEVNTEKNNFYPPSKKIVFNSYLKVNDGLLINHIALSEKISYVEAKTKVEKFVEKCQTELAKGRRIRFHKIGLLYNNEESNIQFEPEYSKNYLENSFGLSSFISPAIKRKNINEKIKENINNQNQENKKTNVPAFYKWAAVIAIPLLTLFTIYVTSGDSLTNYHKNHASFLSNFSFLSSQKSNATVSKKQIVNEIEKIKNEAKLLSNDTTYNNSVLGKINKPQTNNTKEEFIPNQNNKIVKANNIKSVINKNIIKPLLSDKKYKIICGSFGNKTFALKYINKLKKEGFKAKIAGQSKSGFYRVSLFELSDKKEATKQLALVRSKYNKSAWVLTN